jgi:hypothetical protein
MTAKSLERRLDIHMENTPSTSRKSYRFLALFVMVALLWPFTSVSAAAPSNDDFDSPLIISANPYTHTQPIGDATQAPDDPEIEPCSTNNKGFNTVWYQLTPAINGLLTLDTVGSDYDTVIGVWTGSRGSLVAAGCNDDGLGVVDRTESLLQLDVTGGQVYYIEVAAFAEVSDGNLIFHASLFKKSGPAHNSQYMSINPTLSWAPVLDRLNYTVTYDICIDQTNNSTCDGAWTTGLTTTSYQKIGLIFEATYYWQVRAHTSSDIVDADNNTWWSFTTGFGKDAPSNGAESQPYSLQLKWFPHPDVKAGNSYEYCIDPSNNNTCNTSWVPTSNLYANISGLSIGRTYYWQVRAITNSHGTVYTNNGAWWSFTTLVYRVYLPFLTK